MDHVQQQINSASNQSNTGTAISNRQENNSAGMYEQGGSSAAVTDKITNSDVQGWSTETVFIALSSGAQVAVTIDDFIDALQAQHQQYRQGTWDTEFIFLPRHMKLWVAGDTFFSVQFFETNEKIGQRCQFYAIGFDGAERGNIEYSWKDHLTGPMPWKLNSTTDPNLFNQNFAVTYNLTAQSGAAAVNTIIQFTCSFKSVAIFTPASFHVKDTPEQVQKRKAEWEAMEKVKRAKALTMPAMDM